MNTPAFDLCQFADRHQHPVYAELNGDGEFDSPNISFDDYSRMSVQQHKPSGERRLPTPEWALDQKKLRAVVTRYYETRAYGGLRHIDKSGTELERLKRAQAKLLADKPRKCAVLDRLCSEYVSVKQQPDAAPARRRVLESEIEALDTQISLIARGPAVFVALVYLYYSCRLDSVGVGAELGIKPPAVRQLLNRMARVWDEMRGVRPSSAAASARQRLKQTRGTQGR